MKCGVFDRLDEAGVPLGRLCANRLRLAEAYDRGGFYADHLAEHHGTPLSCASSPTVFPQPWPAPATAEAALLS
jgi:alkanesulfonate monooxygenase SsuD/methylene tetrahydromethanopterin reductase-like flavin-dependent oxidoreductase (luciferase family)